jgi:hypothetical protein
MKTQYNYTTLAIKAFVSVVLVLVITNKYVTKPLNLLAAQVEDLEGKISLHQGKALLTTGRTCVLNESAFETEDLVIMLARACYQQYHLPTDTDADADGE